MNKKNRSLILFLNFIAFLLFLAIFASTVGGSKKINNYILIVLIIIVIALRVYIGLKEKKKQNKK